MSSITITSKKVLLSFFLAIFAVILCIKPVFAETANTAVINFKFEEDDIEGAEFSIYIIATYDSVTKTYTVLDEFSDIVDIDKIQKAHDYKEAITKLEEVIDDYDPIAVEVTDADGVASFDYLEDGIYFIIQSGSTGKAAEYKNGQSFLMIVPSETGGSIEREVYANPKTTGGKEVPPETPSNPPETPPETPSNPPETPSTPPETTPPSENPSIPPETPNGSEKVPNTGDASSNMTKWYVIGGISIGVALVLLLVLANIKRKNR